MAIPKTIIRHSKVQDVEDIAALDPYFGMTEGEPRYMVHLKHDWVFEGYNSGTRSFRTVGDFLEATIIPR